MFGKESKDENTDEQIPAVPKSNKYTAKDSDVSKLPEETFKESPKPKTEKVAKKIVMGRRIIDSQDQKEILIQFNKLIREDADIPITCTSCEIETYYQIASCYRKIKSEIRWQNLRLDYK